MKIEVVKERKENGSLVYNDLKECVRKPEGHLKHQRIIFLWFEIFKFTYKLNLPLS